MAGRLFLVPTPLDFGTGIEGSLQDALPLATIAQAARLTHWVCENAKSARAFLKRVGVVAPLATPLQAMAIQELPRHVHKKGDHAPAAFDARPLLAPIQEGHDLGLLSEAGMPAIADPGSSVVRAAHDAGIEVVPLVGPVSLVLALAASGMNGQGFAFLGYLPQEPAARRQRIQQLEAEVLKTGMTQLFIETPYRNAALWAALVETLKPRTRLAIAASLTLPPAVCRTRAVADWRGQPVPVGNDQPAVFAIGA